MERGLQIACGFTELALRTFGEHTIMMAFPSSSHYDDQLAPPTAVQSINYSSVSHPNPYPTLLMSYNTCGVTHLL